MHLAAASNSQRRERARSILSYLCDPAPAADARPADFILQMQRSRPYQVWCKEILNVTREVFWIFLHSLNIIATPEASELPANESFASRHFPRERPPVPAAPYVGGVEWDATNYIAAHLDLINGLIASLPTRLERNELRTMFASSGFEKMMGGSLRLCREKFYPAVHDCLRTWVSAATEDEWDVRLVRQGPSREEVESSPVKGVKGAPKIELPLLGLNAGDDMPLKPDWL
ncbi:hypothetical protein MRB53_037592 [Persea americana]|nr:hypothetical protein MRB53_037592 [Persea americana]